MCDNKGYSTGAVIAAFLGGAAAGAAVALLTAPKTGRDTRHQIGDYYHQSMDAAGRLPEAMRAASHAAKDAMKESMVHEETKKK